MAKFWQVIFVDKMIFFVYFSFMVSSNRHLLLRRKKRVPTATPTTVWAVRIPVDASDGMDELRKLEKRSRANFLQVVVERYLRCPHCRVVAKSAQEGS